MLETARGTPIVVAGARVSGIRGEDGVEGELAMASELNEDEAPAVGCAVCARTRRGELRMIDAGEPSAGEASGR